MKIWKAHLVFWDTKISVIIEINVVYMWYLVLIVSRGMSAISTVCLEIEFNAVRFINYRILRLCSTFTVQSIVWRSVLNWIYRLLSDVLFHPLHGTISVIRTTSQSIKNF